MSCQLDQFLRQLTTVNNHVSLAKYSGTGIIILIQIIIEYHIRVLPLDEYINTKTHVIDAEDPYPK